MLNEQIKELLPDNIRNAMQALQEKTNATDEITLPVTLAVATFATQGLYNANPIFWKECALSNYYTVLVPSGGLKTSISDLMLEGAKRFELDNWKVAQEAETEYQILLKKYDAYIKEQAKKKDDPLNVPGLTAPATPFTKVNKPKYPRTARYMASKFTLNGMINALRGVPHFGIFNSDSAEFFNSHAFTSKETSVEIISALSRLWSGEQIDKLTGIEDIITVGKRTTAMFMLQQQHAGFFVNPQFKDQGFQHRILITQSDKVEKKRGTMDDMENSSKKQEDDRIIEFNDRVYELLTQVDKLQQKPRTSNLLEMRRQLTEGDDRDINRLVLDTFPICQTDGTKQIYLEVYNDMIDKASQEYYIEYQNFMNRAYEHFVRLANVLAIFGGSDMVTEREAMCACGLIYYFIDQRMSLNIDGDIRIDPIVNVAKQVEDYLVKKVGNVEITKTTLNNMGPNSYRKMSSKDRDKVLEELHSRDVIDVVKDGKKVSLVLTKQAKL
jgi:hypothetical protein